MQSNFLGIEAKWHSLIPLLIINIVMLATVVVFAFIRLKRGKNAELAKRAHSRWLGPFFFEYWGWIINPIEEGLIKLKFSPNRITTFGFLLSVGSGLSFATGHFGLAGWLVILGGTFDMFDGGIARRTGQVTKSGAFYDSVMDRFAEAAVFLGLAYYYRNSWVMFVVFAGLIGSMMVSYMRAKGDSVGVDTSKVGWMQRPERIVYLGVGSIFSPPFRQVIIPLISSKLSTSIEYLTIAALVLIAVMTVLTALYRMFFVMKRLQVSVP